MVGQHGSTVTPPDHAPSIIAWALTEGWRAFKRDPIVLVGFFLLKAPITAISVWILTGGFAYDVLYPLGLKYLEGTRQMMLGIMAGLIDTFLTVGMLYTGLRILRREPAPFGTLFAGFTRFVPVLIAYLLVDILIGFGFFFLIIPGIVLALGFSQWALLIMDRRVDGIRAMELSWKLMRGYKLEYFLLWLVLIGINFAGLIPLGVGLLITVPFTFAVQAAFYDRLIVVNSSALERRLPGPA